MNLERRHWKQEFNQILIYTEDEFVAQPKQI